jgi:hypothetical protein
VEKSKTTLPELTCADIAQSNSRITQPHHFDVKGRTVFTNIGGMTLAIKKSGRRNCIVDVTAARKPLSNRAQRLLDLCCARGR